MSGDQKCIILVSKQGLREEEGEEEEEGDQAKVWMLDFFMDSSSDLYDFFIQITWV